MLRSSTVTILIVIIINQMAFMMPVNAQNVNSGVIIKKSLPAMATILSPRGKQRLMGFGVIINPCGLVLTNSHIIGTSDFVIADQQGNEYEIEKLIFKDLKRDLALIKLSNATDMPVVELGDSNKVKIGDKLTTCMGLKKEEITPGNTIVKKMINIPSQSKNIIQLESVNVIPAILEGTPIFDEDGKVVGILSSANDDTNMLGPYAIAINDLHNYKEVIRSNSRCTGNTISVKKPSNKYVEETNPEPPKKSLKQKFLSFSLGRKKPKPSTVEPQKITVTDAKNERKSLKIVVNPVKVIDSDTKNDKKVMIDKTQTSAKPEIIIAGTQISKSTKKVVAKTYDEKEAKKDKQTEKKGFWHKRKAKKETDKTKITTNANNKCKSETIINNKNDKKLEEKPKKEKKGFWHKRKAKKEKENIEITSNVKDPAKMIYARPDIKNDFKINLTGKWFDMETGLNLYLEQSGSKVILKRTSPVLSDSNKIESEGSFEKNGNMYVGEMKSTIDCKNKYTKEGADPKDICNLNEAVNFVTWDTNKIELKVNSLSNYSCKACFYPGQREWKNRVWLRKAD